MLCINKIYRAGYITGEIEQGEATSLHMGLDGGVVVVVVHKLYIQR